jgi:tetratricopeptide (TPR) repeat protein
MEVLGWLTIIVVLSGVAVAPAFAPVRRRLGLADYTQETLLVRAFLRSPLAWIRRRGGYREDLSVSLLWMSEEPNQNLELEYPQQKIHHVDLGSQEVETPLEQLEGERSEFEAEGNRLAEANILNEIGFALERYGKFEDALQKHSRAVSLFRSENHLGGVGDSLNNLGVVLGRLGRFDEAAGMHREALRIRKGLGPAWISNSENNIGVLVGREYAEEAVVHFDRAARLAEIARDTRNLGKAINNKAVLDLRVASSKKQLGRLFEKFESSLPLRKAGQDLRGKAKTQNNLGLVQILRGSYESAEGRFREAATLAGTVEDRVGLLHILENWLSLAQVREDRIEKPEKIRERINFLHADEDRLPGQEVLAADSEALPVRIRIGHVVHTGVALLSSGSTTPSRTGTLRFPAKRRNLKI